MPGTFGPFLEVARIQSELNRLFDNLLDLGTGKDEAGAWIPNVDVVETEEDLLVKVELPGVNAADLLLTVHGGNLSLQGKKVRPDRAGQPVRFHVAERAYGNFRRVVHLGVPVNTRRAEAVLSGGLLRLRFPKVENRRGEPVRVEVRTS